MDKSPEITSLQPMEPISADANVPQASVSSVDEQVEDTKSRLFAKLTSSSSNTQQLIVTKPQVCSRNLSEETKPKPRTGVNSCSLSKQSSSLPQVRQDMSNTTGNNNIAAKEVNQQNQETVVFSGSKSRWYTNEEVASILTNFNSHPEWQTKELKLRPKSGAVLLYSREKVRYRQDGYCWKKRKNGRTTREDHMKLKVQGIECIYGCYVHSALLPTFHRRCYWLLQNPDIVLVHYLNQPPEDQNKMVITFDPSLLEADTRRSWTNEEIIEEIGSVFGGISQIKHTLNINCSSSTIVLQQDQVLPGPVNNTIKSNNDNNNSDLSFDVSCQKRLNNTSKTNSTANNMTKLDQNVQENSKNSTNQDLEDKNNSNSSLMSDESMAVSQEDEDITIRLSVKKHDGNNNVKVGVDLIGDGNQPEFGQKTKRENWLAQNKEMTKAYDSIINEDHIDTNVGNKQQDNSMDNNCQQEQNQQLIKMENDYDYNLSGCGTMPSGDRRQNVHEADTVEDIQSMGLLEDNNQEKLDSCSPVTQIYNKIVDDIESYALPLGENQFNPSSNLAADQHNGSHLLIDVPIDQQHDSHDHNHHNGEHSLSLDHHQHHHHHQQGHHHLQQVQQQYNPQQQTNQQLDLNCGKVTTQTSQYDISSAHEGTSSLNTEQPSCSMDLTSCDIFGDTSIAVDADDVQQSAPNEDSNNIMIDNTDGSLLMNDDFTCLRSNHSLPGHQMSENLGTGIGLSGLINESSSKNVLNFPDRSTSLLIESKFPELFNYKSASACQKQQSDAKSSTSDTDTMTRLTPICPMAPRCNSTDNGMQGSGHSNSFLPNIDPCFTRSGADQNTSYMSSDNPISSIYYNSVGSSCMPSTMPNRAVETTSSNHFDGHLSQLPVDASSSSASTSSQRYRNEQKDSNSSFSASNLLPKALSLDGSDLPSNNRRRMSTGVSQHNYGGYVNSNQVRHLHNQQNKQQNLLLMPSSTISPYLHLHSPGSNQSSRRAAQFVNQRPSAPSLSLSVSPTNIPTLENSSEILVNSGLMDLNSSDSMQQQQQQQQQSSMAHSYIQSLSCQQQQQQSQQHDIAMQPQQQQQHQQQQQRNKQNSQTSDIVQIVDYVPNYCNTSGGAKVLLIGNWISLLNNGQRHYYREMMQQSSRKSILHQSSSLGDNDDLNGFFALFDNLMVSATLIQDNVLKCYAPSHEPGFITLKVLYMNRIVSDQVYFEMRPSCAHITDSYQKLDQYRAGNNNNSNSTSNSNNKIELNSADLNNSNGNNINNSTLSTSANTYSNSTNETTPASKTNTSNSLGESSGCSSNNFKNHRSSRSFNGETSSKVLALAENIISAMHKKNSVLDFMPDNISRLTNSLDIDLTAGMYGRRNRLNNSRGLQYMNGSRSLSRESKPPNPIPYYTTNLDGLIDSDPYWHQSSYEPTVTDFRQQAQKSMQPLSVITNFDQIFGTHTTFETSSSSRNSGYVLGRKRHSSSSAGYLSTSPCQQRASHSVHRPSLIGSSNQWPPPANASTSHAHSTDHQNNCTETSSSGLGSVVSSLSPSTSSLHSPSSTLALGWTGGPISTATTTTTAPAPATNTVPPLVPSPANRLQPEEVNMCDDGRELSPTCSCGRQSSGTPTSADFCEYFQASAKTEESFASLTLNDVEQQELYEAAKVIQKAYRTYRGRKRQASELLISTPESSSHFTAKQAADERIGDANDMMCIDNDYEMGECSQYLRVSCLPEQSSQRQHQHGEQVNAPALVKCYHDREMQAATIIQACYRRYRQYVNFKRQQESCSSASCSAALDHSRHYTAHQSSTSSEQYSSKSSSSNAEATGNNVYWPQSTQVVIETLPLVINKATSSHVDRKRFKTASLRTDQATSNSAGAGGTPVATTTTSSTLAHVQSATTAAITDQSSIESNSTNASNTTA